MQNKVPKEAQRVIDLVRQRMKENGATEMLGFEVEHVEKGRATFTLEVAAKHRQFQGVVHGGILAALADTAGGMSVYMNLPPRSRVATVEMKINYLEPVAGGEVVAEAEIVRLGRNLAVVDCDLFDETRRIVEAHVRYHAAHREQAFVGNREIENLEQPYRDQVLRLRRSYERGLRTVIERGCAEGDFTVAEPRLEDTAKHP